MTTDDPHWLGFLALAGAAVWLLLSVLQLARPVWVGTRSRVTRSLLGLVVIGMLALAALLVVWRPAVPTSLSGYTYEGSYDAPAKIACKSATSLRRTGTWPLEFAGRVADVNWDGAAWAGQVSPSGGLPVYEADSYGRTSLVLQERPGCYLIYVLEV